MQRSVLCLVLSLFSLHYASFAQQKLNFAVYAGSGISTFGGNGAASTSTYVFSDSNLPGYTLNPYGKNGIATFLAGLRTELYQKKNWMLSVNMQYESTGAEVTINKVQFRTGIRDTSGNYKRRFDFLSVNPQIGKIIPLKKTSLILNAGMDYALFLQGHEEYKFYNVSGIRSITGGSGLPGKDDLRITAAMLFIFNKWGVALHYKHGIRNYNTSNETNAFSRILSARLSYTLWQSKK